MKRKEFLKKAALGLGLGALSPELLASTEQNNEQKPNSLSQNNNSLEQVGFEHLPAAKTEFEMSDAILGSFVLHKANTRGYADHGWLKSAHTFSFANYYHPERVHFGALRVLNDDKIQGKMGFGMHPHDNMEIVSIPLVGDLQHKDSMNNTAVIREGDIQIMSAGTGIRHSEMNASDKWSEFLQIWIFPDKKNIKPRYDQKAFGLAGRKNKLQLVVSPKHEEAIWINQDAYISLGHFDKGTGITYPLYTKQKNGVYVFVLEGELQVGNHVLGKRDGLGVWNIDKFDIKSLSSNAQFVLLEVPMTF